MVRLCAGVLALMLPQAALMAQNRPTVLLNADRVSVALPSSILKDRAVRARLESALTTTFILKSRLRSNRDESIVRIEIRFDLWDEVYRVTRIEGSNRPITQQVAKTQLESWWRTPVEIARLVSDRSTVDIELIVLPFSSAEESDAREWLSKSGGARDPSSDARDVIDVLIGTTLSARPIVSYHWSAEVVRR